VVAATVVRNGRGADGIGPATGAPAIVRLPDGRQMAVSPADEGVLDEVGGRDIPGLVGTDLVVVPGPPRYRLP
jgi:hypothetical protein